MKTNLNIALFDESRADYNLLLEFLLQLDYDVNITWIRTGLEALEYIPALAASEIIIIDLIISETKIPGAACDDLIFAIRKYKVLDKIPIAIFTSSSYSNDILTCREAGVVNLFFKPINVNEYKAVILKIVSMIVQPAQADTE